MGFSEMRVEQKAGVKISCSPEFSGKKKRKIKLGAVVNSVCKQQKVSFLAYRPVFIGGKLFLKT